MDWSKLHDFYRKHLLQDVIPFWIQRVDWEHGGLSNGVTDDGESVSTDKYVWSQGRALWTFSALCNELGQNEQWRKIAENLFDFLVRHGRDENGAWRFCLAVDGSVAKPPQSVYADAFAIYGLTEYAKAFGSEQAVQIAEEGYRRISPLLRDHTTLPTMPHPIPAGLQSHGPSMIFALVFHELGILTGRKDFLGRSLELAEIVMTQHLNPDRKLLYEYVLPGGAPADGDAGQTYLAGHAIESMWFMHHIYSHHARPDRVDLAMEAIRWHIEKGWDDEYGGIFLAGHAKGGSPVWHRPDAKVWWPITESLYGLLLAYEHTRADWAREWFQKVHNYGFEHYPNRTIGDWYQNLDRQGRRIPVVVKGLAVKDPFHLPRALLYCLRVLKRLERSGLPCPKNLVTF